MPDDNIYTFLTEFIAFKTFQNAHLQMLQYLIAENFEWQSH